MKRNTWTSEVKRYLESNNFSNIQNSIREGKNYRKYSKGMVKTQIQNVDNFKIDKKTTKFTNLLFRYNSALKESTANREKHIFNNVNVSFSENLGEQVLRNKPILSSLVYKYTESTFTKNKLLVAKSYRLNFRLSSKFNVDSLFENEKEMLQDINLRHLPFLYRSMSYEYLGTLILSEVSSANFFSFVGTDAERMHSVARQMMVALSYC